jgi:hypothetical protein
MEQNEDQRTALEGSDPSPGQTPDSPSDTGAITAPPDAEMDENGKPLPFNEHPKWKAARAAEKELGKLLAENELDSIEDLMDLVQSGKAVIGKGVDESRLDELIAKATKMDQVEEYWAAQRETQKRESEAPEETVERLEREKADLQQRLTSKDALDSSKRALETFEKKSASFIEDSVKDLEKEDREALKFLMGVDHPFGEIDITNEAQVKKMGKQVLKVVEGIEQRAIKKYVAGKKAILNVGSASTPAAPSSKGIQTLRDARNAMKDQLRNFMNH